jgi:cobalt/nickel transport system permease protein
MHIVDALISPAVGGTMWAATAGAAAYARKKINIDLDKEKIPLMGVMGALVFAMQMVNFAIPGTGSSGHIVGGIMLAALLGSNAGVLAMISILSIQALFFADGGLLALGANIINLGFFSCFVAYPLIFKPITKKGYSQRRIIVGAVISSIVALQLGAFGVVMETVLSGKTLLPLGLFAAIMQPIHLAIGAIEGLVTAVVLVFIFKAKPEIMEGAKLVPRKKSSKKLIAVLIALTIAIAGMGVWFASANPDGLEWSLAKAEERAGVQIIEQADDALSQIQQESAILPDYALREGANADISDNAQTSIAGIVGAALTLALAAAIGLLLWLVKRKKARKVRQN